MALAGVEREPTAAPSRAARSSATRGVVLLALAIALSLLHLPWRPRTVCLLRTVTGIPCPFCGGTTAAVDVGRADLVAALRASPLAVLGATAFVVAPLARKPVLSPTQVWALLAVVISSAELWQLMRFGLL